MSDAGAEASCVQAEAEAVLQIRSARERQMDTVSAEVEGMQRWFAAEPLRAGKPGRPVIIECSPTYQSLGVTPLINCKGTFTSLSGSMLLPEVRQAMVEASTQFVQMEELMFAACDRVAELMGSEWALVSCGCAAAILSITAACIAGGDPARMVRLPDTAGLRNEVIVQRDHRDDYDAAVRTAGAKVIEISSREELDAAIGPNTCMLLMLGDANQGGLGIGATHDELSTAEMAEVAHSHGLPLVVDAAAERPDVPNVYLKAGADAVCYSGGKCLRGPQSSGMALGSKQLLQTAYLNASPHHALGRPLKVGKEEIMGLVAAVEQWRVRDHAAEWAGWEARLAAVETAVTQMAPEGRVRCSRWAPGKTNVVPQLDLRWEADAAFGLRSPDEVVQALSAGSPRIEVASLGPAGNDDPANGAVVLRRRGGAVVSTADYHWGVTPRWNGGGPGPACGIRVNPSLMQDGEDSPGRVWH
jgi:L-seryl-tRNA(Ser) seleniumtransferase